MYRLKLTDIGKKMLKLNTKRKSISDVNEIDIVDFNETNMGIFGMNINIQRNIPLFYDNLKPVQRRLLYTMAGLGLKPTADHKSCVKVVGDATGTYHPHGNIACYGALIYMRQPWRHLLPLVDTKGNYGSAKNSDSYAADRYVKCRLSKFAQDCYFSEWDLKNSLVPMKPTFDGESSEPIYLAAKYPVYLCAWGSGMGYGNSTTSPGFLPQEAFETVILLIDNPDAKFVLYPEDPLGCTIMDKDIFKTFVDYSNPDDDAKNLSFRVRATYSVKDNILTIHNTPYGVKADNIYNRIVDLVQKNKLDGLVDMEVRTVAGKIPQLGNDEDTVEIKIEIKKGYDPHIIMDSLYRMTDLQKTFPLNCVYIDNHKSKNYMPITYTLRESILIWIDIRRKIIKRMYRLEINTYQKRLSVLDALIMLFDKNLIDKVIKIMKTMSRTAAIEALITNFKINDYQAKQIAAMRLSDLSTDSHAEYVKEYSSLKEKETKLEKILNDDTNIDNIIKSQMQEGIDKYSRVRQSKITATKSDEADTKLYTVCLTNTGYIKKLNPAKSENSFGRVMEDSELVLVDTDVKATSKLVGFTADGKILSVIIDKVKESKLDGIGTNFSKDKDITFVSGIIVNNSDDGSTVICVTKNGIVKRSKAKEYFAAATDSKGMKITKGDGIVSVIQSKKNDDRILIYTREGKAILYSVSDVTTTSRVTSGCNGIKLDDNDDVVGAKIIKSTDNYLITVSTRGDLKKFSFENNLSAMKRGAMGVEIVSRNESIHNVVGISSKDNIVRFINSKNMDGECVATPLIPLKTRISNGDKLLNVRKGIDLSIIGK